MSSVDKFQHNFYSLSEDELTQFLNTNSQPKYRTSQIRTWVYDRGVADFDQMLDVPKKLRELLSEHFTFGSLKLVAEQISKDGTIKRAYKLHDGNMIESVLMPYDDGRYTACISSQVGCAMGCVFCATGQMGYTRQLTSTEIFEQVQKFSAELKLTNKRVSNVVFMGMGEPLANYNNVISAATRMNQECNIGARHITISTVGLVPQIYKLAEEKLQVSLAVSLHQATDEGRGALMPINKRYPIAELLKACRHYIDTRRRRISFEWALIRGETDSSEAAHELGQLLRGMLCHVNVIPLNKTTGFPGKPTHKDKVDRFIQILGEYGVEASPRVRRGIDIDAGCGQLTTSLRRQAELEKVTAGAFDGEAEAEEEE